MMNLGSDAIQIKLERMEPEECARVKDLVKLHRYAIRTVPTHRGQPQQNAIITVHLHSWLASSVAAGEFGLKLVDLCRRGELHITSLPEKFWGACK